MHKSGCFVPLLVQLPLTKVENCGKLRSDSRADKGRYCFRGNHAFPTGLRRTFKLRQPSIALSRSPVCECLQFFAFAAAHMGNMFLSERVDGSLDCMVERVQQHYGGRRRGSLPPSEGHERGLA